MELNVTVKNVLDWHRIIKSYVEKTPNAIYAYRIWKTLNERHPKSGISFSSVYGEKKWEHASCYILRLYANANDGNTILQFQIDADEKGSLKLSNSVLIDEVGAETLRLTIDGTDILPSAEKNKCTQMRTLPESARDANGRLQMIREGIEKARQKKREVEEKVGGLAVSLEVMAAVLKDDDDLHIGYTRIDNACDLIDFDCENLTMTLNRRCREHAGEPYWEVSGSIEIWNEDNEVNEVIIARGELL